MSTQVDHNKKKRKKTDPHKRQKAAYSGGLSGAKRVLRQPLVLDFSVHLHHPE